MFDLGGVLVDWDPRHLYRSLFPLDTEVETFLRQVCSPAWNAELDRGRPFADAVAELAGRHPDLAGPIEAYWTEWEQMVAGPLPGMVELLGDLAVAGIRRYLLTNSSAETVPRAARAYPFLGELDGWLVSGEVGLLKPDPAMFELLVRRFDLRRTATLLVDDLPANVEGAGAAGLEAVLFTGAGPLRRHLLALGVDLSPRGSNE